MNDYEYELIGESVWNTYEDMAYLLMGEAKGHWEHGEIIRAKATKPGPPTRRAANLGKSAGMRAVDLRYKRQGVAAVLKKRQALDWPGTSPTRVGKRALERYKPVAARHETAPYSGMSRQQLAGRTQADIDKDPYKAPEQKTP